MKRNFAVLAVALLAAAPLTASTFVAMTPNQLVAQADAVVVGQVVERASAWTDSGRLIYTDNVLRVDEVVLGDAPAFVTVRTFGGQVGDMMVEAHGFPHFESDERVLVFLKDEGDAGAVRVLGYQQGHFRVVTRLDGVTLAVPMVDEGVRLLDRAGRPVAEPQSVRLDTFKAQILDRAERLGRAITK